MKEELSRVALDPADSRMAALTKLFDHQDKTQEYLKAELPVFQLYINMAITNIQNICKGANIPLESYDWNKVAEILDVPDDAHHTLLDRLANFFWLFQVDTPLKEFGEQESRGLTIAMVKRLYMLRNFLCHPDFKGIEALICKHSFYTFFSGWLAGEALKHSTHAGLKSEDLFKMKQMNLQEICKENEAADAKFIHDKCTYAFTRKGLIFMICLALYRDEAVEFCQSLKDMKLLRRDVEEELEQLPEAKRENEMKTLKKKDGKRRAFHEFFTYFSMRRSYNAVEHEDPDFACFTDIIGYLNKVPGVAMDYLSLQNERQHMATLLAESNESDEAKETRYCLHRRQKERCLSLLAAYCEDFELFPALHFKRLDTSEYLGRKRYAFGNGEVEDCRQNRHYAIKDKAIRFEYRPEQHYGRIHIDYLRSAISLDELRRLIIAQTTLGKVKNVMSPADALKNYFAAYHRVLEKALCEEKHDYIDRTGYLEDLMTVTGASREELLEDDTFREKMSPYFPVNFTRFFIPQDNIPSDEQLRGSLEQAIKEELKRDDVLLQAFETRRVWQRTPSEERQTLPEECRISDGTMIHQVFRTLNLYLSNEHKYRQLPRMQIHRGAKDTEFQQMHAKIGRFATDVWPFWDALEGERSIYSYDAGKKRRTGGVSLPANECRPELKPLAGKLRCQVEELKREEGRYLSAHPRVDARGRKMTSRPSLEKLCWAAVMCHRSFCADTLASLKNGCAHDELVRQCQRFGVRMGMPLGMEALVKTILNIDLDKWRNAYNYQDHAKYVERELNQEEHVVTQVPLLNGFTMRVCKAFASNKNLKEVFKDGRFQFGRALQVRMNTKIALREFYDGTPLHACREDATQLAGTAWDPALPEEVRSAEALPGRRELFQAAKELEDIRFQDLLLLHAARKYHERYAKGNDSAKVKESALEAEASVYGYFDNAEVVTLGGGLKVRMRPNDRLRLSYTRVKQFAKELARNYTAEELKQPQDFYDVVSKMRRIMAKDRRIRLALMPKLFQLEAKVREPEVPANLQGKAHEKECREFLYPTYLEYVGGKNKAHRMKRFPMEKFNELLEYRNACFHDRLNLDEGMVQRCSEILKYFGILDSTAVDAQSPRPCQMKGRRW